MKEKKKVVNQKNNNLVLMDSGLLIWGVPSFFLPILFHDLHDIQNGRVAAVIFTRRTPTTHEAHGTSTTGSRPQQ